MVTHLALWHVSRVEELDTASSQCTWLRERTIKGPGDFVLDGTDMASSECGWWSVAWDHWEPSKLKFYKEDRSQPKLDHPRYIWGSLRGVVKVYPMMKKMVVIPDEEGREVQQAPTEAGNPLNPLQTLVGSSVHSGLDWGRGTPCINSFRDDPFLKRPKCLWSSGTMRSTVSRTTSQRQLYGIASFSQWRGLLQTWSNIWGMFLASFIFYESCLSSYKWWLYWLFLCNFFKRWARGTMRRFPPLLPDGGTPNQFQLQFPGKMIHQEDQQHLWDHLFHGV